MVEAQVHKFKRENGGCSGTKLHYIIKNHNMKLKRFRTLLLMALSAWIFTSKLSAPRNNPILMFHM